MIPDDIAIEKIITEFLPPVYNFVYRLTNNAAASEDITQEVFVRVWKKFSSYKPEYSLKTWIFTIARHAAIDWLRQKKQLRLDTEESTEPVDLAPLPEELFAQRELQTKLQQALAQLSTEQQAVVLLHYQQELSLAEIATVLDRPVNTVKSQYHRALHKLRQILSAPKQ